MSFLSKLFGSTSIDLPNDRNLGFHVESLESREMLTGAGGADGDGGGTGDPDPPPAEVYE